MSENQSVRLLTYPHANELLSSVKAKAMCFSDAHSLQLLARLERLAPTEATLLVIGETGTGKELIARHVHDHSRRMGPFVAVNCAGFSESLAEAELFGHEAGAFTGAQQARPGWFETANGGTLFLDEIGDMPPSLQVKLLRVLQERQVVRIGSRKSIPIDVRLIAATNVELERAVERRQFRADLYYRLNVAPVRLLPLRERPGDILPLAQHFAATYARRLGAEPVRISQSAQQALLAYAWPGNIRELENAVQLGVIMCREGVLEARDFGAVIGTNGEAAFEDLFDTLGKNLRRLLNSGRPGVYQSVEELLLKTAFEFCDGNQVQTAKRLGISRNVLRAQLKRFGMLKSEEQSTTDNPGAPEELAAQQL